MKKLIIGIVCLGLFWQSANCSNFLDYNSRNFNKNLVSYTYVPKSKKCVPTQPGDQDVIVRKVRNGDIDVLSIIDSIPGQITIIRVYHYYGSDEYVMSSTYGACLMYIDSVIDNLEIEDQEHYVGLHYAK